MKKNILLVFTFIVGIVFLSPIPSLGQDDPPKQYVVNKAPTTPVIDGNLTEAEWAGSTWTGNFYGLDFPPVTRYQGEKISKEDLNWQWRMLWDDEYLYFCLQADFKGMTPNGRTYDGKRTPVLTTDDTGYAAWNAPGCVAFEAFLEPNWRQGDAVNDPVDQSPAYQLAYFPIGDNPTSNTPGNFGVRAAEGPPFFYTGISLGTCRKFPSDNWAPITDSAAATQAGVKPLLLAAQPHPVAGAQDGQVVAQPVLEVAFPFSQFTLAALPDIDAIEDVSPLGRNLILRKDAQEQWVKAGDELLINVTGYTDGWTAETGLTLVTWNDMAPGSFHNFPIGILKFAEASNISDWMLK